MPGVISLHDQNADMPTQITQLQNERDDLRSQLMLLQRNANQREVEVEMEILFKTRLIIIRITTLR